MTIKKKQVSPRQKMINLMYVVLMAMLALNVSAEVLDGFSHIDESLRRTTEGTSLENQALYDKFEEQMTINPAKTGQWYDKAQEIRHLSDSLFVYVEELKKSIIREADGNNADPQNLNNKEDLEAAAQVMLMPGTGQGARLMAAITHFRETILAMTDDSLKRRVIAENLSTDVPHDSDGKTWPEYMFESMPAAAAVTMLTKLQSDIRYAEGEVLHTLMANIDEKDVRVNSLQAFVIPESKTVVRGNRFSATIVMAAVDTTQVPEVFVNGEKTELTDGNYTVPCDRAGDFSLDGYLETVDGNGEKIRRSFSQRYTVIDPTATVSADLMNVLYAGYDNPVSISVPGTSLSEISATMTGGTLTQTAPGHYMAKPSAPGQDAVITVSAKGQQMAQYTFKVRRLPLPTPYISLKDENGHEEQYKGGVITKSQLITATQVSAAVDDGILHIPFRVQSFEMVFFDNMGNAIPVASDGSNFSAQQKETIKRLTRGKRLYISRLTATGPDGTERKLNTSMEVIVK